MSNEGKVCLQRGLEHEREESCAPMGASEAKRTSLRLVVAQPSAGVASQRSRMVVMEKSFSSVVRVTTRLQRDGG